MTASIAHEIKQPLGAISANAQAGMRWLKRSEPNPAEAEAALERIVSETVRMDDIVTGIRSTFARKPKERSAIAIGSIVEEALALTQGERDTHRIAVKDNASQDRSIFRRPQRFAGRNTQRSTLQTPQGLDATHGDELFPVTRDHIGTNSGAQRASFGRSRFSVSCLSPSPDGVRGPTRRRRVGAGRGRHTQTGIALARQARELATALTNGDGPLPGPERFGTLSVEDVKRR
jgi:hypothetical protein